MQEEIKGKKDKWREWWGKSALSNLHIHHIEPNKSSISNIIRIINPPKDNLRENIHKFGANGRGSNVLQMLRELKGRDYRVVFASLEYCERKDYFRIVLKKEPQPLLSKSVKRNIRFNSIVEKKRNDF